MRTLRTTAAQLEARYGRRTVIALAASVVVHVILLAYIASIKSTHQAENPLTEITWFDDVAEAAPPPKPAAPLPPEPRPEKVVVPPRIASPSPAGAEPIPAAAPELGERPELEERVARIQQMAGTPSGSPLSLAGYSPAAPPRPAGVPSGGVPGGAPVPLARAPGSARGTGTAPVALERAATGAGRPVLAPASAPSAAGKSARIAGAPARSSRNLAGATLLGPVADRALVSFVKPVYPEWAKRDAVEASVTINFTVLPDGRVKDDLQIQSTSGFGDFDRNARDALLTWRFAPLGPGVSGEQWGTVTFDFRLTGAGGQ